LEVELMSRASTVYFYDLRKQQLARLEDVVDKLLSPFKGYVKGVVGVKVHMGEEGNVTHLRPEFVRAVVDWIRSVGGDPVVFDTTTLYAGSRNNGVSYLNLASRKGFNYATLGAPIVIGDGLKGNLGFKVAIRGVELSEVEVAEIVGQLDSMVVLSHFKGHVTAGFGGAIKNLAMGCTTKKGKASQHRAHMPRVLAELCTGCGTCVKHCIYGAIQVVEGKARVNYDTCVGCLECYFACPNRALEVPSEGPVKLQARLADAALAVLSSLSYKPVYLNALINITSRCDCLGCVMTPIMGDIGFLSSLDPVAIDQASIDLVKTVNGGVNPFLEIHGIDGEKQLEYGEKLGLGLRAYSLVEV